MTRTTRVRLVLLMTVAAGYGLLGIAVIFSHFTLHGVIDTDAVSRVIAAFLIEYLAYETYVVREKLGLTREKLDLVRRNSEVTS